MTDDKNWDKENIVNIDVKGKSYLEAIEVAQKTLGFFIKCFEGRETNLFKFFIKARFEDENHIEHLWLMPIDITEDIFTAIVNNVPNNLTNVKFDDILQIKKDDVEDWLIWIREGEELGNFIKHSIINK